MKVSNIEETNYSVTSITKYQNKAWSHLRLSYNFIVIFIWTLLFQVRLVDGPNEWTGRVEILFDGVWGTVCDDFWEDRDARVVCRQLGYPGGEAWSLAEFGEGSGAIHLDNVECTGEEPGLSFCPQAEELDDYLNCGHYEDAGVECGNSIYFLNLFCLTR